MSATILVVDDDPQMRATCSRILKRAGYETLVAPTGDRALEMLDESVIDGVVMDVQMPGRSGVETLDEARTRGHSQPVVIMSGAGEIEIVVAALKAGAYDFVEKPLQTERLLVSVKNGLHHAQLVAAGSQLRAQLGVTDELVGESPGMIHLKAMIRKTADSNGRVLITGENGTGKELVARALHRGSPRADGPFVKLNCAAVPNELIESELFGHEKGAFTGAVATRKGKFELAHRGTLFLDEVGDMPAVMQAKLLRVLQEGELEKVGSSSTRKVDVRVIAATNRDLDEMVNDGTFREDLYYRLNVVSLEVPPLRQRGDDVRLLVTRFLETGESSGGQKNIEFEAMVALCQHDYPGNVRELRNVIERMLILVEGETITESDVGVALSGARKSSRRPTPAEPPAYQAGTVLKEALATAERGIIEAALRASDGSMTECAKSLGIERSHLYKKVKALGIER